MSRREAHPQGSPGETRVAPAEAADRVAGRPVPRMAADPDRSRDERGHRRPQLPRAVPAAVDALPRAAARRSRRAARPAGRSRRSSCTAARRLGPLRRLRQADADRRLRPRHGGLGRARAGGGAAACAVSWEERSARCPRTTATGCGCCRSRSPPRRCAAAKAASPALKLRLGRERLEDDLARDRRGPRSGGAREADVRLQPGPVHGRRARALPCDRRPWPVLVRGADGLRQLRGYAQLAASSQTPSSSARTSTDRATAPRPAPPALATWSCPT